MKIVKHPYHAIIVPQAVRRESLWQYVIRRHDSPQILVHRDAATKEDACSLALLEISQLVRRAGAPANSLRKIS
jgi:hypothetical protein